MKNILIVFLLGISTTFGQVSDKFDKGAEFQIGNTSTPFIRVSSKSGNKIVGSEYLNEEWEPAIVYDSIQKKKINLLVRFNAYSSEIELLKEKEIAALKPVDGISVDLGTKRFVPKKIESNGKTIFVEQLVLGEMSLFRVFDVKVNKAASDANLLGIENEDKLVIVSKLFWEDSAALPQKLPSKKKLLIAIFNSETQKYIKKEKLSLKKEADLIRAFNFQNSSS